MLAATFLQVRPKGLSPAHLTSQLHLLLKDPSYAAAAADMGARLRGVNGPATAAALIAEFAGTA
jgi:UDP:flavonoid glycosyltransferase YjiC (YdhE family)